MQMLLATKSTIQVLDSNKNAKNAKNTENGSETKIDLDTENALLSKKKEYRKKVDDRCVEEKKKSINMVVDSHNKLYNNVDRHIKREINKQEDNFRKAMRERRARSINRSLSRSINKGKKEDDGDTSNILKHLKLDSRRKVENPFES